MPIQTKKIQETPCEEVKTKNFKIEVASIQLEYDPNLSPMRSTSKAYDFFDRRSQLDRNTVSWYFGKIKADLADEGQKSMFSLPHWHIRVNNLDLFKFMNKSFTRIDLILGQEKTYWKFTRNQAGSEQADQIIEGENELSIGTCSCCIDTQYQRILEDLRKQNEGS